MWFLWLFIFSFSLYRKKIKQIQADNHTDELTGLLNHKALKEELKQITEDAKKTNKPLSIILMDIDDLLNRVTKAMLTAKANRNKNATQSLIW